MNKVDPKSVMLGVTASATILFVVSLTSPPSPAPAKCEASSEAKATISALTDTLKKSMDGLSQACVK